MSKEFVMNARSEREDKGAMNRIEVRKNDERSTR